MSLHISIVIPTIDRQDSLIDTTRSIISQETDFGYEVLVLDNGCHPIIRASVQETAERTVKPVRYVPVPEPGLHSGRHAGARHAQSDILLYVDDDIIAAPGWLQAIAEAFQDSDVRFVGGPSLPRYEAEPPDWLEAFWTHTPDGRHLCGYLSLVDLGDKPCEMDPNHIWGLNFAIRKQTLEMLGGFHPDGVPWELRRYRGDGESAVTRKAKALGLKAIYRPDALVYHRVPQSRLTVEYFERRAYLQGISDSFTTIRANRGLAALSVEYAAQDWKAPLRWARRSANRLLRTVLPTLSDPYRGVRQRVRAAYEAGYQYHQEEVRNDPALLEWVLRPDYWNAVAPQGTVEKGAG